MRNLFFTQKGLTAVQFDSQRKNRNYITNARHYLVQLLRTATTAPDKVVRNETAYFLRAPVYRHIENTKQRG
jgi:hypothetical protein